ncbi:unnamed protein product [Lepeophtheirus salmonis]|uniref:(salmon louse) hypothetical protein n=1 Tax=Lepeophtheirus salmonis TaxID=72036 RepID=A0A7R8CR67_LEPSM|nr:unnamed protein product [Lepeophtheirus salmonis]CAF2902394.1 unnamed protein product [Lepeophtheirus salmonis]
MLEPGEVRRLVAEYDVEDALPLSTVESLAFQKLVSKIPVPPSEKMRPTGGVREKEKDGVVVFNKKDIEFHFCKTTLPSSAPSSFSSSQHDDIYKGIFLPSKKR